MVFEISRYVFLWGVFLLFEVASQTELTELRVLAIVWAH